MKRSSLAERFLTSAATGAWFCLVYNFTNWVSSLRSDIGVAAFAWEQQIPFVPIFIIPYWSIDLFFMAAPFFLTDQNALRVFRRRIFATVAIAGTFFLLFPLELQFVRPKVEGLLGVLFGALENMNNFWNLAPSLHIALRTMLWTVYMPLCKGPGRVLLGVWFICVGLSTLLCWQHHVFDVFTGQLLGMSVIQVINERTFEKRLPATKRHRQLAMRYAAGAAGWVLLTWLAWTAGFILLWPAVSFLLVALAYWRNDPQIFGKSRGKLTSSAWWLFLPYRVLAQKWQSKYLSGELTPSRIAPELSFGPMPKGGQLKNITAHGILDLTAEYPGANELGGKQYRSVPMLDLVTPTHLQLAEAVEAIEELRSHGEVYVHCALGLGRSAAVAAAWLLYAKLQPNPESAIASVVECCKDAVIKEADRKSLDEFKQWMQDGR